MRERTDAARVRETLLNALLEYHLHMGGCQACDKIVCEDGDDLWFKAQAAIRDLEAQLQRGAAPEGGELSASAFISLAERVEEGPWPWNAYGPALRRLAARAPSSGEPAPPDLERAAQIADEWAKHPSCTPGQPCEHQRTAAAIAERIRALPPAPSAGEAAPASVSDAMLETLAERVHTAYLETCARLGWSVSPANAVPYAELSDAAKELDRATVRAVLSALPVAPDRAPYDPAFGDDRECVCGHRYVRHFDTYDAMRPIGCKLCACEAWRASSAGEAPPVEPQEQRGDRESPDTPPSNALAGINTRRGTGHIGEAALRTAHAAAPAPVEPPQVAPPDRAQVEPRGQQGPILSAGPVSGPTCPTCCGHDHSKDGDALAVLASESAAVQRMLKEHDREGLAAYVNRHARARAQHAAEKVREISSELASSAAQGEPRGEGRAEGGDGREAELRELFPTGVMCGQCGMGDSPSRSSGCWCGARRWVPVWPPPERVEAPGASLARPDEYYERTVVQPAARLIAEMDRRLMGPERVEAPLSLEAIERFQAFVQSLSPREVHKNLARWRAAIDAAEAMAEVMAKHQRVGPRHEQECEWCKAIADFRQHVAPRARP